ncbi:hypothetical protein HPB47_020298, partial [Ixodes persulcatus]
MAAANDDADSGNIMRTSRFGERAIQEQGFGCESLFLFLAVPGRRREPAHRFIQRSKWERVRVPVPSTALPTKVVGSQATRTGQGTGRSRSEPSERRVASSMPHLCPHPLFPLCRFSGVPGTLIHMVGGCDQNSTQPSNPFQSSYELWERAVTSSNLDDQLMLVSRAMEAEKAQG